MYQIKTYNKISDAGLSRFNKDTFSVSPDVKEPDAIILRSQKLHSEPIADSVLAIGRAGAGVNNIPVDECTQKGIVVFNTPGANANAVKELVLASMILSSRNMIAGANYSESLKGKGDEIHSLVEAEKSKFKGGEISGKTLGVIGLGAIGVLVANDAIKLGMKVLGYDPFISISHAWGLSSSVKRAEDLNRMLSQCDYITLHMPLTDKTKDFLNKDNIQHVKEGATILNFARDGIVNEDAVISALENKKIGRYVSDFPSETSMSHPNAINFPHLGASTKEAEKNCAVMVVDQVKDYLENGNIRNSVNFPNCYLERSTEHRLLIFNENVPNMVGQITTILAEAGHNISEMMNKSKNDLACTIVDVSKQVSADALEKIKAVPGILSVRQI